MKEKIYTIPVSEAFQEECECPMCLMEKRLEEEYISNILGPSLMEPEHRVQTNRNGFCRRHFELLYNSRENSLGLGLIIDTHLQEQNALLKKIYEENRGYAQRDSKMLPFRSSKLSRLFSGRVSAQKLVSRLISHLSELEGKCHVCSKLNFTMDRYVDVILYLWFEEEDFKNRFNSKKGFCLKHLRLLLEGVAKYLNPRKATEFVTNLMDRQLESMELLQQEVNWFTKKFDYRHSDAPWGNSKDALPRSIRKIVGYCDLK